MDHKENELCVAQGDLSVPNGFHFNGELATYALLRGDLPVNHLLLH